MRKKYFNRYVLLLIVVFVLLINLIAKTSENSVQTMVNIEKPNTIIIDAGHGGVDGGAVGLDDTLEKDLNLQISDKTTTFLKFLGYDVINTRIDDNSIHADDATTIREKKVSDLKNRVDIINDTPNSILISIHQNKFTESKYRGSQTFYSPNDPASEVLADNLQNALKLLSETNDREIKKADKNIYLLWNAKKPSVIVECGFLSNQQDLDLLKSDEYQRKLAYTISLGVMDYCGASLSDDM